MSGKRTLLVLAACFATATVLAGVLFLNSGLAAGRTVYTQLSVLTEVLSYVTDNYVEKVEPEDLVDGAIKGMLDKLDPHSNYLDPERFKRMQERNRGAYYGIGVEFDIVDGNLTVITPIAGSPSEKLGIRPGDVIVKIEGENAKGIKQEDVFTKLRGERGTVVHVTIRRPGEKDLLEFDIVRDEIPIYSVPNSFMLQPGVGYIRLVRFSSTTSDELEEALGKLEAQGMEKLLLDLRGNAGGYLNEAIEVSDLFLPGGKKIVYTLGRIPDSNEEYFSTGRAKHTQYPLIVLIDHSSASASEIVSGAMQDWDRGLIVGQRSFGKGLVQRQYPLKNGGALLLTVARYYTPSGRLIQRDYSDKERYIEETAEQIDEELQEQADTSSTPPPVYHTAAGRTVYGGGGITPDVKLDQRFPWTRLQGELSRAYFDFANLYIGETSFRPASFESFRRYEVGDDVIQRFESYLKTKKIEYEPDSLKAQMDLVRHGIKREMARNLWGDNERWNVLMDEDPQIQEALALMPQAELMARHETTTGEWQTHSR
ncbi:MAG: S41 family peptidase [Candidatus Eisenbacteria bacterium]|nr:S41 family peptidase [Candidatus Eisenbacteria bacterium]